MDIYTVTIVNLEPCVDIAPWTAAFSSRERAEEFLHEALKIIGDSDRWHVSMDSGELDDTSYLEALRLDISTQRQVLSAA